MTLEDLQRAAFARYDTALAFGAPIPPELFTMRTLDPGNDADDKKQFFLRFHGNVGSHYQEWSFSARIFRPLVEKVQVCILRRSYHRGRIRWTNYDVPVVSKDGS